MGCGFAAATEYDPFGHHAFHILNSISIEGFLSRDGAPPLEGGGFTNKSYDGRIKCSVCGRVTALCFFRLLEAGQLDAAFYASIVAFIAEATNKIIQWSPSSAGACGLHAAHLICGARENGFHKATPSLWNPSSNCLKPTSQRWYILY
jgi:hypothetical protein